MKLSTIFSVAALAFAAPHAVSANFSMYEGTLVMDVDSTEEVTAIDSLYLDMSIKDAYNEAHAGEDFVAEVAVVEGLDDLMRRDLNEDEGRKLYTRSRRGSGIIVGGHCTFCRRRNLKGGDENRQLGDEMMGALLCNKLATGTNPKFHGVSNCQISLLLVE